MTRAKVHLTRHDRKDRLGHGGVKAVAEELGIDAALVSRVLNGKQRHAGVEAAIAKRIVRSPAEIAFPPRAETPANSSAQPSHPSQPDGPPAPYVVNCAGGSDHLSRADVSRHTNH